MGVKELYENMRKNQARRRLEKLTRRLCEKYAQDYERYEAAEELDQIEGDDATFALLQRFGVQVPKITDDEQEKKHVFELVLAKEKKAIPAILRYLREKENLAFPIRLLVEIAGPDEARRHLLAVLAEFNPEYNRVPEKKIDIIRALGEYRGEDVTAGLRPFLHDPNDDVVLGAAETLANQTGSEEAIRNAFLDELLQEGERPRVYRRLLELLAERKWSVEDRRDQLEPRLPQGFSLDKKGIVIDHGTR